MSFTFVGCFCRLVLADEAQTVPPSPGVQRQAYGAIVELCGGIDLQDKEQCKRQFPGLSKVESITTNYALITCHSLIPDSSHLGLWKFSEAFLGPNAAKKPLNKFVSGIISCCGKDSFLTQGTTAVVKHEDDRCNLGLNITVLFLNERFKTAYCTSFPGAQAKPPSLDISQCKATTSLIYRFLSQARQMPSVQPNPDDSVQNQEVTSAAAISQSGSFEVVTMSSNGKPSLSAVELCIAADSDSALKKSSVGESISQSETQLAQDVNKFELVKVVRCKGNDSSNRFQDMLGIPVLYVSNDKPNSAKLAGVLIKGGKALILSAFFQLLQGDPAACLSLLINTEVRRLWIHKWCHLLIPNLENLSVPVEPSLILEILIVLVQRREKEHTLSVSLRDDPKDKLGFLKLLQVLFHYFNGHSVESLTQMTAEVCTKAKFPLNDFLDEVHELCESVSSIAKDCCDYENKEKPEVKQIVEHCFLCATEMLNYTHEQEIVETVLCVDEFESALTSLQKSCEQSLVICSCLVSYYRKLNARSKAKCTACSSELESCQQNNVDLHAELKELKEKYSEKTQELREKDERCTEQNNEYHQLEKQHKSAVEKHRKALNTLKDTQKGKKEIEGENEMLKEQLKVEERKRLKLEEDCKMLQAEKEVLAQEREKIVQEREKLVQDSQQERDKIAQERDKLSEEIKHLMDVNSSLNMRIDALTNSSHKKDKTIVDLLQSIHTTNRQHSSASESRLQSLQEAQATAAGNHRATQNRLHNSASDSELITMNPDSILPLQEQADSSEDD